MDGLNVDALAELLRLPRQDVDRLLDLGAGRETTDADRAEVEAWLGG